MISTKTEYLAFNVLERASVQVKEEIKLKFYDDFLKTTLFKNNIQLKKTSKILSIFIEESKTYEIIVSKNQNSILEVQIYEAYYLKYELSDSLYDLFVCDNYFTVYKHKKFYFVKDNKNYEQEDILKYLRHTYKINITNCYYVSSEQKNLLKEIFFSYFSNAKVLKYYTIVNKSVYNYFLIFLMSISTLFAFLIFNQEGNNENKVLKNNQIELKNLKTKYDTFLNKQKKKSLTQNTVKLFYYLKYHKVNLVSFDYNKKLTIVISSKKRGDLSKFLMEYKNNSKIIQIEKKDDSKVYEMMVEIKS
jgi:hypothetical protein